MTSVILICGAMLGLVYMGGIAVHNLDRLTVRKPAGLVLQNAGFITVALAGFSGGLTTLFSALIAMAVFRYMWRIESSLVVGGFVGVMVQAFSTRHIWTTDMPALGATAAGLGAMLLGMMVMPSKHVARPIARTVAVLTKAVKTMRSTGWAFSRSRDTKGPSRFSVLISALKNPLPMVKAAKAAKPASAKAAKVKPTKAKTAKVKTAKPKPVRVKASKAAKSPGSGSDADSSILTRIAAMSGTDAVSDELEEIDAIDAVIEEPSDTGDAEELFEDETKRRDDEVIAALEEMLKGEI